MPLPNSRKVHVIFNSEEQVEYLYKKAKRLGYPTFSAFVRAAVDDHSMKYSG